MNFGNKVKYFNYRPLVSICLFFMAGIVFAVGIYVNNLKFFILSIFVSFLLSISLILKCLFNQKLKLFKLLSIVIAFFFGFGLTTINLVINDNNNNVKGEYYISGRVCGYTFESKSGYNVVSLDDVEIKSVKTLKSEILSCKVRLYLEVTDNKTDNLELGEKIKGKVSLKKSDYIVDGKLNFYMINKNVKVLGFANEDDVASLNKIDSSLFDKIKIKIKSVLNRHLSKEYSGLGYTMLFGDKTNLDEELSDNFSASGISHLLAVSGLHVGFVVTLLSIILSLFKANNKVRFVVITLIVFLYAFMCGFSVSVTRAFIMTTVLLFSQLRKKKYDGLSSLAVAAIIILIINPLFLFDVGFILSFSAVAGIILFSRVFTLFFSKFFHSKLASNMAVSLSATIGTLPAIIFYFDRVSIFSIITNLLVIPIASVAYMFMFAFVFIAIIFPGLGVFIYIFEFLMKIVAGVSQLTGAINLANENKLFITLFSVFLISSCIFISDYYVDKKKSKIILSSIFSGVTIVSLIVAFIC